MSAYGIDHLHAIGLSGRGQTIAITGAFFSPTLLSDANRFSREFHLPRLRVAHRITTVTTAKSWHRAR